MQNDDVGIEDAFDEGSDLDDADYVPSAALPEIDDESESDAEFDDESSLAEDEVLSKDKKMKWSLVPMHDSTLKKSSAKNIIRGRIGITAFAKSQIGCVSDTFKLYINRDIRELILKYTNLEGLKVFGDGWNTVSETELIAFMGLFILSGVFRAHNQVLEELWEDGVGPAVFSATMSLKRFKNINRVLRFDDRTNRDKNDRFAPIREIWDMWTENLKIMFIPGAEVTVDEQLMAFRGRCSFIQYIPSKPNKYGLKFWLAVDNDTHYVYSILPYTGKAPGASPEKNLGKKVVLTLVEGLKGRNITCDNFFSSYELLESLLAQNITMVGTVRKNKAFLPVIEKKELRRRQVPSSKFYFSDKSMLVEFVPKKAKVVHLISSLHDTIEFDNVKDYLPAMVAFYNGTKPAVDAVDQRISNSTVRRRTNRWPTAVFHNMLDISCNNGFALYQQAFPAWKNNSLTQGRRLFLKELGMELVREHIQLRERGPRNEGGKKLFQSVKRSARSFEESTSAVETPPTKRIRISGTRCDLCIKGSDRKAYAQCAMCKKNVCGEHKKTKAFCATCGI